MRPIAIAATTIAAAATRRRRGVCRIHQTTTPSSSPPLVSGNAPGRRSESSHKLTASRIAAAERRRHEPGSRHHAVPAIASAVIRKYIDSFSREIDQKNNDGRNSSVASPASAGTAPKPRRASLYRIVAPATNITPFRSRTEYELGPNAICSHDSHDT